MPHGGRRPGAGAPKGNLNGLKHGKNSRRFRELLETLAEIPEAREVLLAYHRHQQRKIRRARRVARALFTQLLLQMPPQPDAQLNQVIDHLRKLSTNKNEPTTNKNAYSNQVLKESNQLSDVFISDERKVIVDSH